MATVAMTQMSVAGSANAGSAPEPRRPRRSGTRLAKLSAAYHTAEVRYGERVAADARLDAERARADRYLKLLDDLIYARGQSSQYVWMTVMDAIDKVVSEEARHG